MKRKINSVVSADTPSEEMTSLNSHLLSEFSIEELEARLETDPLMLSQIFGITVNGDNDSIEPLCGCRKLEKCPVLECIGRGGKSSPCSPICEFSLK